MREALQQLADACADNADLLECPLIEALAHDKEQAS
jgi:hypothetical protein